MKKNITIFIFTCISLVIASAQDPKEILNMAILASEGVKQGYYEMTSHMKFMTHQDTSVRKMRSWFKKLSNDECFGFAFHTNQYAEGNYDRYRIYTGNDLIGAHDSTGTITAASQWKQHILDVKHNYDSYSPFTEPDEVFPSIKELRKKERILTLLPSEELKTGPSHRLFVQHKVKNISNEPMQVLDAYNVFWIDQRSNLILQYEYTVTLVMNGDTMVQHERVTLDSFIINQPIDETKLTASSVPSYVALKEYTPYKEIPLLSNNTPAPSWTLLSLNNDSIGLDELKGKVVLIDFFYKSCYPCMQALPALQALHEKYKDQGLVVVGINPIDKPEDELAAFLQKRDVNYTVLYADDELPKTYNVTGYPTIYLVDKEGIIIYGQPGYGPSVEKKLEDLILKHL